MRAIKKYWIAQFIPKSRDLLNFTIHVIWTHRHIRTSYMCGWVWCGFLDEFYFTSSAVVSRMTGILLSQYSRISYQRIPRFLYRALRGFLTNSCRFYLITFIPILLNLRAILNAYFMEPNFIRFSFVVSCPILCILFCFFSHPSLFQASFCSLYPYVLLVRYPTGISFIWKLSYRYFWRYIWNVILLLFCGYFFWTNTDPGGKLITVRPGPGGQLITVRMDADRHLQIFAALKKQYDMFSNRTFSKVTLNHWQKVVRIRIWNQIGVRNSDFRDRIQETS